jgi:transportin-1
VRQSAGLLLRNLLLHQWEGTDEPLRATIRADLLAVLGHPHKALRRTAASAAVAVLTSPSGGLSSWPGLVAALVTALSGSSSSGSSSVDAAAAVDGALDLVYKIAEEAPQQLDAPVALPAGGPVPVPAADDADGSRASMVLVPPLLRLMASPSAASRRGAVAALNLMLHFMPSGLSAGMDDYIRGLFALATDGDAGVRRHVVAGLVSLLPYRPDALVPQLPQIVEYMLACNQDGDEEVALEAAEFWMAVCDADDIPADALRPFLPRLIPVLLKNMLFDEYDEEVQDAEAAEEAALARLAQGQAAGGGDADRDVRPAHVGSRHGGGGRTTGGGGGGGAEGEDVGGEDGEDEDDDDDDDEVRAWNLRKCSAAALDTLSNVYNDEILPVLLPIVQQRLEQPDGTGAGAGGDWRARESAILALGAVSEGCATGLAAHLPAMVGMLVPRLTDPRPMVRVIACWALSRYAHWLLLPPGSDSAAVAAAIAAQQQREAAAGGGAAGQAAAAAADPNGGPLALFDAALAGLLARVALDHNKHVQEAACGALSTVFESAGASADPRIGPPALAMRLPGVVDALAAAAARYGRRNQRPMLEAIVALSEAAGTPLGADAALSGRLLRAVLERWERFAPGGPGDLEAVPFLECLTVLAPNLRAGFEPVGQPVFERAAAIATHQAQLAAAGGGGAGAGPYERDLLVAALDLVAGVVEALRASADPLVAASPQLLPLLMAAAAAPNDPELRQSALALAGDLARACYPRLHAHLAEIVPLALACLTPASLSREECLPAANNACWSLGELAVAAPGGAFAPHAVASCEAFAGVLTSSQHRPGHLRLRENAAIAIGRVAWVCPDAVAPHLQHFLPQWCGALRSLRDDVEKEQAFLGLVRAVRLNPSAGGAALPALAAAVASWARVKDEGLRHDMADLLRAYRAAEGGAEAWQQAMAAVGAPTAGKLALLMG